MHSPDSDFTVQRSLFQRELQLWGPRPLDSLHSQNSQSQSVPPTLEEAQLYCRKLATSHYENFSVASYLLPGELRQHFFNVYAYCRWSDDLADEVGSSEESLRLLQWWSAELNKCSSKQSSHPVMIALEETIRRFEIPLTPFQELLDAFTQDQTIVRYESDAHLIDYCRRSANPVGRILLKMAAVEDPDCLAWSDSICTGLQLANFCQDMSRDAKIGRIYFPKNRWSTYDLDEQQLLDTKCADNKRAALRDWVEETRSVLELGRPLSSFVPRWLQRDVTLFLGGGLAILDAIERNGFDVWTKRIEITKWKKGSLLLSAVTIPMLRNHATTSERKKTESLRWSHLYCRQVSEQSGSSFYRSFAVLRPEKRQAMTALYAFARIIDDVADSPTLPDAKNIADARSAQLRNLQAWRRWVDSLATELPLSDFNAKEFDPVDFNRDVAGEPQRIRLRPAMKNAIDRFQIPIELLHGIIEGAVQDTGDLRFESLEALRNYCYRVASTVGLSCLSIWRGEIEQAKPAAIECGMAFQWTNILRDLREDGLRGRIYLPMNELREFGVDADPWLKGEPNGNWRELLRLQFSRAHESYRIGWNVIDSLEPDGQRMFSLMWQTYYSLLKKLESDLDRIWTERISLPLFQKIGLVATHFVSPFYLRQRSASHPSDLVRGIGDRS